MGADDAHHRTARLAPNRQAARENVDKVAGLVTKAELGLIAALTACDGGVERARALLIKRVEPAVPKG
jgi:hypothetical protein